LGGDSKAGVEDEGGTLFIECGNKVAAKCRGGGMLRAYNFLKLGLVGMG